MAPLFAIIITIIILVLAISEFSNNMEISSRTADKVFSGALVILCVCLFTLLLKILFNPSAMDVYQGKTTLEVTYKDNVPIDSVVVWKSKQP